VIAIYSHTLTEIQGGHAHAITKQILRTWGIIGLGEPSLPYSSLLDFVSIHVCYSMILIGQMNKNSHEHITTICGLQSRFCLFRNINPVW